MLGMPLCVSSHYRSQFATNRIRFRFRDNIQEQGANRLHKLLKEGRHQLRFLKRANLGDLVAVEKVLQLTYGRTGKRKHELLAVLEASIFVLTL